MEERERHHVVGTAFNAHFMWGRLADFAKQDFSFLVVFFHLEKNAHNLSHSNIFLLSSHVPFLSLAHNS